VKTKSLTAKGLKQEVKMDPRKINDGKEATEAERVEMGERVKVIKTLIIVEKQ